MNSASTSLTFILLLFSYCVYSQIVIEVKTASTSEPIENIAVFATGHAFSSLTNKQGLVTIKGVASNDTLVFQHPSFYREKLTLKDIQRKNNQVYMIRRVIELKEFVVAASKTKEEASAVPNQTEVISRDEISYQNPQTSADMLKQTGSVYVQKSQMGGGSPVLRGFEANKVLLVIDGIRLNNAIYRSGHLQNVITIDPAVLERTEVIFGPGSVIYGSDALGGVMHFYTLDPTFGHKEKNIKLNAFTRYASANNEKTGHVNFNLGFKKLAFLTSVTFSDFDDMRIGRNAYDDYPDWGKRFFYADRINGNDTMIRNENVYLQRFTGYSQWNIMQKVKVRIDSGSTLTYQMLHTSSTDIPRYDKLVEYNGDQLKYAEWHYGPQQHWIHALHADFDRSTSVYDHFTITAAYQDVQESRIKRRLEDPWRTSQIEDVTVLSFNADFIKDKKDEDSKLKSQFLYGIDFSYNNVRSDAFSASIENGDIINAPTRYPDGSSETYNGGIYALYKHYFGDKLNVSAGARYSHYYLASDFNDTSFYIFPFRSIVINTGALTGSAGIVYQPTPEWTLNMNLSSGFRAPNVDDYGKVRAKDGKVTVPNNDLKPEYAYNSEFGIGKKIEGILDVKGIFFLTYLNNAIVRTDHQLNDQDSIFYEGELHDVQTNTNAAEAFIYGIGLQAKAELHANLLLETNLNYTVGRDITSSGPLAHIPPLYGRTSVIFSKKKWKTSFYSHYNGWKHKDEYALTGEDNFASAVEEGTPAWYTLNLRASYRLFDNFIIQGAVENILDQHYRPFASGVSAPGRNFIATLRLFL